MSIEDAERLRHRRAKPHEVPLHGKIVRIFPQDGYAKPEVSRCS